MAEGDTCGFRSDIQCCSLNQLRFFKMAWQLEAVCDDTLVYFRLVSTQIFRSVSWVLWFTTFLHETGRWEEFKFHKRGTISPAKASRIFLTSAYPCFDVKVLERFLRIVVAENDVTFWSHIFFSASSHKDHMTSGPKRIAALSNNCLRLQHANSP